MPNELEIRQDGIGGLVEDNPLSSSATTLTSAALAAVNAVTSTSFMWIILDPDGNEGAPEHVKVTAHTAGATTATILRAQNGTTQREHVKNTPWIHGPVAAGFPDPITIDFAQGVTPTASVAYTTIANITDGNDTTSGTANTGTFPQWVQIDLGSAKPVRAFRVLYSDNGHTATQGRIQYSSDGTNWITVRSWHSDDSIEKVGPVLVPTIGKAFGEARYWRHYAQAVVTGGFGIDLKTFSLFGGS